MNYLLIYIILLLVGIILGGFVFVRQMGINHSPYSAREYIGARPYMGGGGFISGLLLLVVVSLGAWFLTTQTDTEFKSQPNQFEQLSLTPNARIHQRQESLKEVLHGQVLKKEERTPYYVLLGAYEEEGIAKQMQDAFTMSYQRPVYLCRQRNKGVMANFIGPFASEKAVEAFMQQQSLRLSYVRAADWKSQWGTERITNY